MLKSIRKYLVFSVFLIASYPAAHGETPVPRCDSTSGKWGFGKYVFVDKDSRWGWLISPQYVGAGYFSHGLAAVKTGETWGFIDQNGHIKISPAFEEVRRFGYNGLSRNLCWARQSGRWGVIDHDGRWAKEPEFNGEAPGFSDGLAAVSKNGVCGFINDHFEFVIEPKYQECGSFSFGLANVKNSTGKWGYIDARDSVRIGFEYEYAKSFLEPGVAYARADSQDVVIDGSGKALFNSSDAPDLIKWWTYSVSIGAGVGYQRTSAGNMRLGFGATLRLNYHRHQLDEHSCAGVKEWGNSFETARFAAELEFGTAKGTGKDWFDGREVEITDLSLLPLIGFWEIGEIDAYVSFGLFGLNYYSIKTVNELWDPSIGFGLILGRICFDKKLAKPVTVRLEMMPVIFGKRAGVGIGVHLLSTL